MRLRVLQNTQANYQGRVYGPGETFECSHQESWFYTLMVNCAEEVTEAKRTRKK